MAMDINEKDLNTALVDIAAKSTLDIEAIDNLRTLADASRTSLTIRKGLANLNVLSTLLRTIDSRDRPVQDGDQALDTQILRCVGNSCASNPQGIISVTGYGLNWLHQYFSLHSPPELRSLAIRVLYNICAVDFEGNEEYDEKENPALSNLYQENFHLDVVNILVGLQPEHPDVELLVDALFWISSAANSSPTQPPHEALWRLLDVRWFEGFVNNADAEVLASLIESTISLCRPKVICEAIVNEGRCLDVIKILTSLEARLVVSERTTAEDQAEPDTIALLVPQASGLIWLLSDISTDASFGQKERLNTPTIQYVLDVLQKPSSPDRMMTAACIVLGNGLLNLPEDDTEFLVHNGGVPRSIFATVLRPEVSPDLFHAVASLMIVLSKPSTVAREEIANLDQAVPAIEKLCTHSTPQVRDAGIKALQALGRDSATVQQRFATLAANLRPTDQGRDSMEE